jgi:hypothetical protein
VINKKKIFLVITAMLSNGIILNAQIKTNSSTLDTINQVTYNNLKVDTVFDNSPVFTGDYFSNNAPDVEPLLFAEGLINPKIHHFHSAPVFSPDYDEMYFSVYLNYDDPQRIFISKRINGTWQKPELANFSGQYQDGKPILSPDGKTLYFYSKRPIHEGETSSENSMIWFVKKNKGSWGKPKLLSFNPSLGIAFYPDHYASNGIFYFSIKVASGDYDLYQCEIQKDKPFNIKRLDEPVSMKNIVDLGAVANAENNILVFQSNNRNNKDRAFLYASTKQENGEWGDPVPLSDKINQISTRFASFSRDGLYFFFVSSKSGVEEIYWIKSTQLFSNH